MKLFRFAVVAGLVATALVLAGCAPAETPKTEEPAAPWMLTFDDGVLTNISATNGYQNTYSYTTNSLAVTAVDKETDTGFTPLGADLSGTWQDTGLNLGTKSLRVPLRTDTANGHVVLSLKNLSGMDRAGRTGFTFTIKFLDAPSGSAVGLMPHLRYNDGTSENKVAFADEKWFFKTDAAYFVVKYPFSDFTKPSYGEQTETTIATLPASVVFNQVDFDFRIAPVADGKFALNTTYNVVIDNVGFY
jgi:hypothetical protein